MNFCKEDHGFLDSVLTILLHGEDVLYRILLPILNDFFFSDFFCILLFYMIRIDIQRYSAKLNCDLRFCFVESSIAAMYQTEETYRQTFPTHSRTY